MYHPIIFKNVKKSFFRQHNDNTNTNYDIIYMAIYPSPIIYAY